MDALWDQLGLETPGHGHLLRVGVRLLVAALLGGLVGIERQAHNRWAGLRTHMIVSLGTALFTIIPWEAGAGAKGMVEVVKGIAAGIGFLGGGTILKVTAERQIEGLTTAATIWLTAAVGFAVGAGWVVPATIATVLSLVILTLLKRVEDRWKHPS
ncbi:MAG: MgtC/SapB family protein [Planctomycetia bacterium]|nr:MgtC/SapB family protein [Planctomycetia bacterium]